MDIFKAHFSACSASHCLWKSYDFFKLSLCCSMTLFRRRRLACFSFSSNWYARFMLFWWKSLNFFKTFYWSVDLCAWCFSFNNFEKCYLFTLSNFSFEIWIFFNGDNVLVILVDLLNAFELVFSNCYRYGKDYCFELVQQFSRDSIWLIDDLHCNIRVESYSQWGKRIVKKLKIANPWLFVIPIHKVWDTYQWIMGS